MKNNKLAARHYNIIIALLIPAFAHAQPIEFTPLTPTTFDISATGEYTVSYSVTNRSRKYHTLEMETIQGVTQTPPASTGDCGINQPASQPWPFFTLPDPLTGATSCTLTLEVIGSQMTGSIIPSKFQHFPVLHQGPFFRFSPELEQDNLNITLVGAGTYFAGGANGITYFSIDFGKNWTAMLPPSVNIAVNSVYATDTTLFAASEDGYLYATNNLGEVWLKSATQADTSPLEAVFVDATTTPQTIYVGTANGHIYSASWNGNLIGDWILFGTPSTGHSVDGLYKSCVFCSGNPGFYAGSSDSNVYFSTNGASWSSVSVSPDGSAVKDVYVTNTNLYYNTKDEYVYTSTVLTPPGNTPTTYAQTAYSLFANYYGTEIEAGTQGGYVYSLSSGKELGHIANTQINSIFWRPIKRAQ